MLLSPCRFNAPLTDNEGQPIDARAIVDLHRELLGQFGGFTIHPTSQGRWQSRAGRVYQEEVVVYEVAIAGDQVGQINRSVRSARYGGNNGRQGRWTKTGQKTRRRGKK